VEREVDPGYLAVSDSEVAGYTDKKQPAGWWSILVIAERGAGESKPGYLEVSDVEVPGWHCGVFRREQIRGFHDLLR
jgi:hypothetical protein